MCFFWFLVQVDDFLRSGRVQFAGVPVAREASALLRLHQALVKHFEHLELHDRVGGWVGGCLGGLFAVVAFLTFFYCQW